MHNIPLLGQVLIKLKKDFVFAQRLFGNTFYDTLVYNA